ncbi:MAG TPA: type I-E CRISPR-associated protein Cas5/CasD [Nitrospiraceae bacterium]|nr:type I-E CRISPR-associated protein Cas5/CasD [Nitrospiraceae bacterium]
MNEYLILRLKGVLQSWGGHTFEDFRPSNLFPTRSGLVGLLAACLGIDRKDIEKQKALTDSFLYAVRVDNMPFRFYKITDFHTVLKARRVSGKAGDDPVVSRREYLCDASFTVAMRFSDRAAFDSQRIVKFLQKPVFTPFLGRRSCPLSVPPFHSVVQAESLIEALSQVDPCCGTIYSEVDKNDNHFIVRDVPLCNGKRQFATRTVYIHSPGGLYVSE